MLSPGILFPAGYLVLYLSTNIYLNSDFKKNLSQSFNTATDNNWQISVKSLKSGLFLDSVTLDHIELKKREMPERNNKETDRTIIIKTLEIPYPDLQKLLFSSTERLSSIQTVHEKIIAKEPGIQ